MKFSRTIFVLAGLCVFGVPAYSAEKKESVRDREKREAEEESAAESKLSEGQQIDLIKKFSGKFEPAEPEDSADPKNPDVVGTLTATTGQVYLIKLENPALLKVILEQKKQEVTVTAKQRNKGKYLLVSGISLPEPVTPIRTKRGGV